MVCCIVYVKGRQYRIYEKFHMGRKKQWTERIILPLAEGTTEKIDSLLQEGEVRLDFIRDAIEREMKRRKRSEG